MNLYDLGIASHSEIRYPEDGYFLQPAYAAGARIGAESPQDSITRTIDGCQAEDHIKQWACQKQAFAAHRGSDPHSTQAGRDVPRTTVQDIFGLLEYWSNEEAEGLTDSIRWSAEAARAVQLSQGLSPDDVYPENERIWYSGFQRRAIDLESTHAIPSKWELVKESVIESINELPGRIRDFGGKLKEALWPSWLSTVLWVVAGGAVVVVLVWLGRGFFARA